MSRLIPPMSPKLTVERLLASRTDPLDGWPRQARVERDALLEKVDTVLATLSADAQRIVFYRYTLHHSVLNTARWLDMPVPDVERQLAQVHTTLAQALRLKPQRTGGPR